MTDSESAQPPAQPPASGGGRAPGLDWAAVGAVAGAVAALVALVAYLAPPDTPQQPQDSPVVTAPVLPAPEPVTSRPTTPAPAPSPSPEPVTTKPATPAPAPSLPEPVTSRPTTPAPAPPLPAVRPGGCDKALTALAAYRKNAGTTRNSQAAAAGQAHLDLMSAVLDAEGTVGATISRLAAEFQELNFRLTGMIGADPNQVVTDINMDIAQLTRLCGS
ncbi:hypothetical protein ACFWP2_37900 [Kitasatospora sp. NPDC058444]|uniref:hypothetical protein n=1 Tax=Kitasatospora sp. NPDC058444 TaxID=3346504 RepID=UPI00364BE69B